MSDNGFLSRWSRRKTQVARGEVTPPEPMQPALPASVAAEQPLPAAAAPAVPAAEPEPHPPPTMDDVAALTPESDYARFLSPEVDEPVKRAAMKKLFTDPHFNVMDGLDTYIDDYSKPDPIPPSMLRSMVQSQMLGLFDDEEEEKKEPAEPKASPDGAPAPAVPQSVIDPPAVPPDEDPDLRLQQDDAAGRGGPREGPAA